MEKNVKVNKGITLIALVITIIVLLILAGVTLSIITGKNGILNNSIQAKENTRKSEIINSAKIDILKKQKLKRKYELSEDELNNILIKYGTVTVGATDIFDGTLITEEEYQIPVKDIYDYEKIVVPEVPETPIVPEPQPDSPPQHELNPQQDNSVDPNIPQIEENISISSTKSYVGCYADFEGGIDGGPDGIIDGIIFADLAVGSDEKQWTNLKGVYAIPRETGLKEYYVKGTKKDDRWDKTKYMDVIAPKKGTLGKERFYVMALSDLDEIRHTWYENAYGNMNDYKTCTSVEFGAGKSNTVNMIKKYNENGYGNSMEGDLWKTIQGKLGGTEKNPKWFVPSRSEWSAFAVELGITSKENIDTEYYGNHNLKDLYWSSSQYDKNFALQASFKTGSMGGGYAYDANYVRLATKF